MKTLLFLAILCASAVVCLAQDKSITTETFTFPNTVSRLQTGPPDLVYRSYSSYSESIESSELTKDGKLEIVKRSTAYPLTVPAIGCYLNACDFTIRRLWKEVYAVKDGKIVLEATIEGKIVPAVRETYEWPK